jgi:hypothetical protein
MVQLGHISRHSGDYEKAKEWWAQAAGMDNARGMLALGDLMSRQSVQEGGRWYEEAANLGDAEAMGELTRVLGESEPGQASRWFDLIVAKEEKPSTVHKSPNVLSRRNLLVRSNFGCRRLKADTYRLCRASWCP